MYFKTLLCLKFYITIFIHTLFYLRNDHLDTKSLGDAITDVGIGLRSCDVERVSGFDVERMSGFDVDRMSGVDVERMSGFDVERV